MAKTREHRRVRRAVGSRIEIGSGDNFPDISFIWEMKDYRKMSKVELLAWIEKLKSKHATRTRTQRERAASALRDSAERLRAILETAVEGIITIDERGIVESFNLAAERIFGFKAAEIIGKNISVLMPSPHHEQSRFLSLRLPPHRPCQDHRHRARSFRPAQGRHHFPDGFVRERSAAG